MSQISVYKNKPGNFKKREVDYSLICKLRDAGTPFEKIRKQLGCSLGTVQYALKLRKLGKV